VTRKVAKPRATARGPRSLAPLALALTLLAPSAARAAAPPPADVRAADALAALGPAPARDPLLAAWAKRAPLADLMYVLRRPSATLGAAESPLLSAALAQAPPARAELRRALLTRLATADPKHAKRWAGELAPFAASLDPRARASVFRVALVLPDSGDYASYGAAVRAGAEAALEVRAARSLRPLEGVVLPTAAGAPAALAAAYDTAFATCGALIGELLSTPTLALALGARHGGPPVVSPTATDERLGGVGAGVIAIGPSGHERGAALARALLADGPQRVGALVSTADGTGSLASGFTDAARALGATVAYEDRYAPGDRDFRARVKAIVAAKVQVLVWDGDSNEGDALFQELARQRASVVVCGGEALAPERYHTATRRLLEGVWSVGEDWALPPAERAALDSVLIAHGAGPADGLTVRGWIAASLIADAVDAGALTAGELAAALGSRVTRDPWGAARRYLDGPARGLELPLTVVQRGKAVPAR
jgi:ABC-type branched-subunit amino acid transport system substrate-binding protein